MKKKTINIGFPIEYEDDDQVCHYGLFLRENEVKAVDEKLQELQRKDNNWNELKDIINKMIYMGYCAKTGKGTTAINFVATGENSEFGTRAKYILDKIKELEEK